MTHTNDLTSLALTCSTLHNLSIPHMYSRFDIVWPESLNSTTDDYAGVDALSYGLSTLVMGEDVFHQLPLPSSHRSTTACSHCGCDDRGHHSATQAPDASLGFRSRRGNYYAQYTRTFSIGNGPLSWVQEYSVNREVGKMLGTLVALAVARMVNLEAFIWDMPTGVVREIWFALASLANRPGHECRLERIWVRWHDNSENSGRLLSPLSTTLSYLQMYRGVEHPSLSVLPPLKSVTVLDIDEPAYAEELAILIERSRQRLVELRIGIAARSHRTGWTKCQKDDRDQLGSTGPWPKAGGVLSILSKHDPEARVGGREWLASVSNRAGSSGPQAETMPAEKDKSEGAQPGGDRNPPPEQAQTNGLTEQSGSPKSTSPQTGDAGLSEKDKLNLEVLELERVPLSVPNLLPTLDWTRLTTLTLMQCDDHEQLWRALRRKYAPPTTRPQHGHSGQGNAALPSTPDYSLNIRHLRTDTVSPYMMLFIKDALAPNTLESVYLHEAPDHEANVHIDAIYKHILRKHRLSLRKVLVDASERDAAADGMSTRWHKWMFNHEMISFVTSGRMPQLRELGMAMRYRDWVSQRSPYPRHTQTNKTQHFLLQRLPNMPQLRALYLPHISHSVHTDRKELALQVLDIVSIRPDLKITYIGLESKCYQILEGSPKDNNNTDYDDPNAHANSPSNNGDDLSAFDDDPLDDGGSQDDEHDTTGLSSDSSDESDSEAEGDSSRARFRVQEILFYDDKISIFKARHGVL